MDSFFKIFAYQPEAPLIFTRLSFWIFFVLLYAGFCLVYQKRKLKISYLFIASLFFYYKSGGYFFWLLLFSTITDYYFGKFIARSGYRIYRRIFLALSIITNLSVLAYFKYAYFFTETLNQLFGADIGVYDWLAALTNAITGSQLDVTGIILPVGISFYTFQTISYTVDVYRRKVQPVTNIIDFGFYVTFFPQLVAGPIVRAADFIPQLYRDFSLTKAEFSYALFLIINGLIKKVVISDFISINFVDRIFESPESYSGFENLMAIYGYGIQIYCDFSGYTDIAIGLALMLGFRLPLNFNSPYKACSITDFWRRWHISLSSWLRDYLYIPLGGNRISAIRTFANLAVTMLLGGLWHGANIRFIIWGAMHGLALAAEKLIAMIIPKGIKKMKWIGIFLTFQFVSFTWLFFRAADIDIVNRMIERILYHFGNLTFWNYFQNYTAVFSLIILAYLIHWIPARIKGQYRLLFHRFPLWVKIVAAVTTGIIIMLMQTSDIQPFIYFQF